MKYIVMGVLMAMAWATHADEIPPYGCKPIEITSTTVVIPKSSPSLVLINNISEMDLWVTHPISDPGASAGWSSRLQSKHWSALALSTKPFELGCIESKPGHEQQVPCLGALLVCEWPDMTGADQQKQTGSYWVGENMSLRELLAHISQRGFKVPEPPK